MDIYTHSFFLRQQKIFSISNLKRKNNTLEKPLHNNSLSWLTKSPKEGGDREIFEETVSKRMEKKNIISVDTEETCDTIKHPFIR